MKALTVLALLVAGPAVAAQKWVPVTTYPPPDHTCDDVYRARDLPETYGGLYVPPYPIAAIYCTPVTPWVPQRWRERRR